MLARRQQHTLPPPLIAKIIITRRAANWTGPEAESVNEGATNAWRRRQVNRCINPLVFCPLLTGLSATVIRGRRKLEGSFPSNRFYCYLREGWVVETHSAAKFSSGEDSSEAFKTKPLSKGARFTRQKLRAGSLSFFKITICASA